MIPNSKRDKIQADAYRKLVASYEQATNWDEVGIAVSTVIEDTTLLLKIASLDVDEIVTRLGATRWCRLPNTQFVRWPDRQTARMVHANGTYSHVLHDKFFHYRPPEGFSTADVILALHEVEASLFATDDELIVFWRGNSAWTVMQDEHGNPVFSISYGVVHIWDGDTHHESRAEVQSWAEHTSHLYQRMQQGRYRVGEKRIDLTEYRK